MEVADFFSIFVPKNRQKEPATSFLFDKTRL